MPRSKVDPSLRRRVARACDSCKRRKERCSGATPCDQCASRQREPHCKYTTASQAHPAGRPLLREAAGSNSNSDNEAHRALDALEDLAAPPDVSKPDDSPNPNSAPLSKNSRILRDSNGKFSEVHPDVCDEKLANPQLQFMLASRCEFTADPLRHRMIETAPPVRFDKTLEPALDLEECSALVQQYFLVASGVMDLFDPAWMNDILPSWLADSTRSERLDSPLIYLVLAIGAQSRAREEIDDSLAEQCFGYGRQLAVFTLMDNPSLLTVQAFILITYYMISACRRNGAFSNLGVAVRAAYALGIHRHETNIAFVPEEGISRERAWKTLRVCDLFLSASMGRPLATSESGCNIPWASLEPRTGRDTSVSSQVSSAIFRICHIFERVMVEVYTRRTVSLELAGSISGQLREWTEKLPHMLKIDGLDESNQHQSPGLSHRLGSSVVTMAYYWSIILLTRPFLIFKVCHYKQGNRGGSTTPSNVELNTYADACIDSAIKGIEIAYEVTFEDSMPCRHPIVVNSVFISSLCIGLAFLDDYDKRGWQLSSSLDRGIAILRHFGRFDPLSARYSQICQLLQVTAGVHINNRDSSYIQSSSHLIQNIFGNIRHLSSLDSGSGSTPGSDPQHAEFRSQGQDRISQRQQMSPSISTPQPHIWEPISPSSFHSYSIQQESLITTSGVLTGHSDPGGDYHFHDHAGIGELSQDLFYSDIPYALNGYAAGDNMPLFSLTTTMSAEGEYVGRK